MALTTGICAAADLRTTGTPLSLLAPLGSQYRLSDLRVEVAGDRVIDLVACASKFDDLPTSENGEYTNVRPFVSTARSPFAVIGEITLRGERFAELLVFSRWLDSAGRIHTQDSVVVTTPDQSPRKLIERSSLLSYDSFRLDKTYRSSTADQPDYVIITSRALADTFERLRRYKLSCGYHPEIVLTDDIMTAYSGRDSAERVRNYLKTFYNSGGKYVLLGGDGSIVPVRYAYPYSTSTTPDLKDQLVCDLYYADMTGDWDTDSDGVWGERYDDRADLVPELLVGRLPVDSAAQVSAYIDKLIQYETAPGGADPSYLGRALFFSSDQMRDYGDGGQHAWIAQGYPPSFTIDTGTAVEALTGEDLNPTNAGPTELPSRVAAGYGIVNVIAHGRYDGFVLKSSGYNESPKQYVLAQPPSDIQCPFDSLSTPASPSFYYSLACDNGGFDLDRAPFSAGTTSMCRALIESSCGAVAFVANSRWGWIGSSYLMQRTFFDSLFAHPNRPAISAMYESQSVYWYYRDLVYGQLFFGDPTVHIYPAVPNRLTIDLRDSLGVYIALVHAGNQPIAGSTVVLSDSGQIVATAVSDRYGQAALVADLSMGHEYTVTAQMPGASVGYRTFTPSMNTGVDVEPDILPGDFALLQNYPNPFNPSTVISFDLPAPARTTIEIYNTLGRRVVSLVDRRFPAGRHTVVWEGRDASGHTAASGVYFYRMTAGNFSATRKLTLIR